MTLVFVGNVDARELAVLSGIAARQVVRPFDLAINAGAYFKRNRIASAAPASPPGVLTDLVSGLQNSLRSSAITYDARPYVPHVTLLRDARQAPPPLIEPPHAWRVDAVCLVRSQPGVAGVTYEVVARSPSA